MRMSNSFASASHGLNSRAAAAPACKVLTKVKNTVTISSKARQGRTYAKRVGQQATSP